MKSLRVFYFLMFVTKLISCKSLINNEMSASSQSNRGTQHNENNKFDIKDDREIVVKEIIKDGIVVARYRENMPLLREFYRVSKDKNTNEIKYPMCVYAGTEDGKTGAIPEDPKNVVKVMTDVVNEWNQYLAGYNGYPVTKITFKLIGKTEKRCNKIKKYMPYIIYSHPTLKDIFGGQAKIITMNVPGESINTGFNKMGKIHKYEHGHILGLAHSIVDGSIMHGWNKEEINEGDILGMKAIWDSIRNCDCNKDLFKD